MNQSENRFFRESNLAQAARASMTMQPSSPSNAEQQTGRGLDSPVGPPPMAQEAFEALQANLHGLERSVGLFVNRLAAVLRAPQPMAENAKPPLPDGVSPMTSGLIQATMHVQYIVGMLQDAEARLEV